MTMDGPAAVDMGPKVMSDASTPRVDATYPKVPLTQRATGLIREYVLEAEV
jgi:hypothetical protein